MQTVSEIVASYDAIADRYFHSTKDADMSQVMGRVTAKLAPRAFVVDAGCGSGRDTRSFRNQDFRTYSYDASPELVTLAQAWIGPAPVVQCHPHTALSLDQPADCIWANASLLFLEDDDLKAALRTLSSNLANGGLLFTCFKTGSGRLTVDGRSTRLLSEKDIFWLADMAGLAPEETWTQEDTLGRPMSWTNFLLRKR